MEIKCLKLKIRFRKENIVDFIEYVNYFTLNLLHVAREEAIIAVDIESWRRGLLSNRKEKKPKMQNITINIPEIYDDNIQKLIKMKITASRSEAIRIAIREFLLSEFENLKLLGYFKQIEV